jgi:GNAT superfamily N-acetyltransferase
MAPDQLEQIREDFRLGRRCFAFRRGDEIVAASWCDTKEIHFPPCRRALARNEAYLYHAEVSRRYRGHDLAGHLRAKSYAALRSSGCDLLYSYSDYFNRPAKRFKEKIGARVLVVGLHLGCFGLWEKNWVRRVNDPVLPASPSSGAVSPR